MAGSLALALMAHECHVVSGTINTTSGDGLTWVEGGEGVITTGTTPNFDGMTWANNHALVPTSQAVTAKSTTSTATLFADANVSQTGNQQGKGWGVLLTVKPEPIIRHGLLMSAAGSE
jgi:hypothetical protein